MTYYRGFQIIPNGSMFYIVSNGAVMDEFNSVETCKLWIDAEILLAKKRY